LYEDCTPVKRIDPVLWVRLVTQHENTNTMKYIVAKQLWGPAQQSGTLKTDHVGTRISIVEVDPEKAESIQTPPSTPISSRAPSVQTAQSMGSEFPEGGLTGWLVVFGSFCAMLSVFGLINTAAVFESWFSTHQLAEYSASQIGWIFSLYLFFVFFIGIQVGPVFDAYGPRYLVAIGSALMVASLLLLGFCTGKTLTILTLFTWSLSSGRG
jgi:hypothetical protein